MSAQAEQELRDLVDQRVAAVLAKDPAPLIAQMDPELHAFSMLPPLSADGIAAETETMQAWFDGYSTDIGYEVRDVRVRADGSIGFVTFLYHVSGTLVSGGEVSMWARATLGCRHDGERWLIVHDHESVPFDAETGQALTTLTP
ncbi:MAG: nuclear transport factor 2 family protein [Propionibacteriaceae bacterium]